MPIGPVTPYGDKKLDQYMDLGNGLVLEGTKPWASYQIPKIAGCACAGNAGNVFPRRRFQRKLLVSDPGMHHGTCVTHVPWCMSGSLTCGDGENVPGIPGACAPAILCIWQEAHYPGPCIPITCKPSAKEGNFMRGTMAINPLHWLVTDLYVKIRPSFPGPMGWCERCRGEPMIYHW